MSFEIGMDELFAEHAMEVEMTPEGKIVVEEFCG